MICGDTVEAFRTEGGTWCLLLADGMGSGEEARRESAMTCRLLRQFLEADISPEAALTTLNSAMALRGAETGSFTTVDLCVLRGRRRPSTNSARRQLSEEKRRRPADQRQQPAGGTAGYSRRPGRHHRPAGAGQLRRDDQ